MTENPMTQATYTGPLARGIVVLPSGERRFVRGEPIDVDETDAAALDDDWTVKTSKSKTTKTTKVETPEEGTS